jgi:plasmid stabilization system protein ParE
MRDINVAKGWLLQVGSGEVARKRYRAILRAIYSLPTNPVLYRRSEDHPHLRVISVAGYRVLYKVDPDTGDTESAGDVEVLAVLGLGEP